MQILSHLTSDELKVVEHIYPEVLNNEYFWKYLCQKDIISPVDRFLADTRKICSDIDTYKKLYMAVIPTYQTNISRLRQINQTDPLFYEAMGRLARCLYNEFMVSNKFSYLDTHMSLCERRVDDVLIAQRYRSDNTLKTSKLLKNYLTDQHPCGWVCPFYYQTNYSYMAQSCNPLYIEKDKVHLTTCATGAVLYTDSLREIHSGCMVTKDTSFDYSTYFGMPTYLFIHILLENESLGTTDSPS
jgi:hypothetical protein